MSDRSMAEVMDALAVKLQRAPLVWVEDGMFIVRDEKLPGFRYDFDCESAGDGLRWVAHLAQKSWVTTEHLEQFASLAADLFKVRHR
jgi:hypothetical protein